MGLPVRSLRGLEVYGGANPRKNPKINSRVAKQIRESLLNRDGVQDAFHLAHLGITIVATDFQKVEGREDAYRLRFKLDLSEEPDEGIVNGLHTMAVIEDLLREEVELSPNQYVSFTVITGIPDEDRTTIIPFIAKGRNTVLQVKEESIDNLMGRFDTLKAVIEPMPYQDRIGWEESANRDYHVLDVLAIMTALNPLLYPNENGGKGELTHPIDAADHKRGCLKKFAAHTGGIQPARTASAGHAALVRPDPLRGERRVQRSHGRQGREASHYEQQQAEGRHDNGGRPLLPLHPDPEGHLRQDRYLRADLFRDVCDSRGVPHTRSARMQARSSLANEKGLDPCG